MSAQCQRSRALPARIVAGGALRREGPDETGDTTTSSALSAAAKANAASPSSSADFGFTCADGAAAMAATPPSQAEH